jgi:hypothetical protein
MVAAFLAQDGMEAVMNIRDEIAIRGVGGTNGDWLEGTVLNDCMCDVSNCDIDKLTTLSFCTIDSTASSWTRGTQNSSIKKGFYLAAKLKSSFNVSTDGTKSFLKYDYNPKNSPSCAGFTGSGICSEDTKFTRYINIQKDPTNTNPDEAKVSVLVSWDSPLGPQKIPLQKFIYNYSENL